MKHTGAVIGSALVAGLLYILEKKPKAKTSSPQDVPLAPGPGEEFRNLPKTKPQTPRGPLTPPKPKEPASLVVERDPLQEFADKLNLDERLKATAKATAKVHKKQKSLTPADVRLSGRNLFEGGLHAGLQVYLLAKDQKFILVQVTKTFPFTGENLARYKGKVIEPKASAGQVIAFSQENIWQLA